MIFPDTIPNPLSFCTPVVGDQNLAAGGVNNRCATEGREVGTLGAPLMVETELNNLGRVKISARGIVTISIDGQDLGNGRQCVS